MLGYDLRDLVIGQSVPKPLPLLLKPRVHRRKIISGSVDGDKILSEDLERAELTQSSHAPRYQASIPHQAIDL